MFFYERLLLFFYLIPIVVSELTKAQGDTKSFAAEKAGDGGWVKQKRSFRRITTLEKKTRFLSHDL